MRNALLLLIGIILLYLATSLMLHAVYGPSYGFLQGEDCWVPDGNEGWVKHGNPEGPPPDVPSVNVPILARYLPIFLPGLLLALFLFTPLRKYVDSRPISEEEAAEDTPGEDTDPTDSNQPPA
ncbi:MAG: hypothetical protein ABII79_00690 [bacterium]